LDVEGKVGNEKVKGKGFMELVGYSADYNNLKFASNQARKIIKQAVPYIKKIAKKINNKKENKQ